VRVARRKSDTGYEMLIIGLTGSMGMGKSTVALRLRELRLPVTDADAVVHALYEGAAVSPVEAAFPGVTAAGRIDRAKLSAALLKDPSGFKRLEAIVHPLVHAEQRRFMQSARDSGAKAAVIENPLLLEMGGAERVDVVIVVSASEVKQRERILQRPGMTEEKLETILSRQTPDTEKRRRADFVVDTNGTIEESRAQVDKIINALEGRIGTAYQRFWT